MSEWIGNAEAIESKTRGMYADRRGKETRSTCDKFLNKFLNINDDFKVFLAKN